MSLLHVNEILMLSNNQNKEINKMISQINNLIDNNKVSDIPLLTLKYYNDMLTDSCKAIIVNNGLLTDYQTRQKQLLDIIGPLYNQYQDKIKNSKLKNDPFQEINEFNFLHIQNYKNGKGYTILNSQLEEKCKEIINIDIKNYSIYVCLVIFKMYNMLKSSAEYNFDIIAEDQTNINDSLSDKWQAYHQKQKHWLSIIESQKNLLCEKINKVIISDELKKQLKGESAMGGAHQRQKSRSAKQRIKSKQRSKSKRGKSRNKSRSRDTLRPGKSRTRSKSRK